MVEGDLNSADGLFACRKRVVAVEGGISLLEQLNRLKSYILTLLANNTGDKDWLEAYSRDTMTFIRDLRKPVYLCVVARFVDIPMILQGMAKVKWDLNHVSVQYSPYVDIVNRVRIGNSMKSVKTLYLIRIPIIYRWFKHSQCDLANCGRMSPAGEEEELRMSFGNSIGIMWRMS